MTVSSPYIKRNKFWMISDKCRLAQWIILKASNVTKCGPIIKFHMDNFCEFTTELLVLLKLMRFTVQSIMKQKELKVIPCTSIVSSVGTWSWKPSIEADRAEETQYKCSFNRINTANNGWLREGPMDEHYEWSYTFVLVFFFHCFCCICKTWYPMNHLWLEEVTWGRCWLGAIGISKWSTMSGLSVGFNLISSYLIVENGNNGIGKSVPSFSFLLLFCQIKI